MFGIAWQITLFCLNSMRAYDFFQNEIGLADEAMAANQLIKLPKANAFIRIIRFGV